MTDFFVDIDDAWVDTDDDFWGHLDAVPIDAQAAILQAIGKVTRLQPISFVVLAGILQKVAQSGMGLTSVTHITILVKAALLKAIGKKIELPFGDIAWAWGENPAEIMRHFSGGYYMGPLEPGWSGTGQVLGSEKSEHLAIDFNEYMDSPPWNMGVGRQVKVDLDKYTRKSVKLPIARYRTGLTKATCESALWNSIVPGQSFGSAGYVQIRLGSTGAVAEGAFYSQGGFDWESEGGFDWE